MSVITINKISTPEELKDTLNNTQLNITGFHQITLDEYLAAKQEIADRLQSIAEDFVAIGFRLRQIKDSEAYRQEGYTSINDFAKKEYGLSESTVSRFIAINIRFSVGGYSDKLLPEYRNFGSGKLSEMLTLSDEDCRLITQSTTVATIREIKKFNKESETNTEIRKEDEQETAEVVEAQVLSGNQPAYSDFEKVIIEFFREERELLNEIYRMSDYESIVDRINPSGSRTFRKKVYMLFMYGYGEGLILKKMGEENTSYTWQQFIETTVGIYKDTYTDHDTVWENFYNPEADITEQTEEAENEEQNTGIQQGNDEGSEGIAERTEEREEKHIPLHNMDVQDSAESKDKGGNTENEDKKDSHEGGRTEPVEPKNAENEREADNKAAENKNTGSSDDNTEHAIPQENNILSLRRWYMENKNMSLDMGVKQEIADRMCIRTTPEEIEKIAEFIEELAVEYTAYVYKNMERSRI